MSKVLWKKMSQGEVEGFADFRLGMQGSYAVKDPVVKKRCNSWLFSMINCLELILSSAFSCPQEPG